MEKAKKTVTDSTTKITDLQQKKKRLRSEHNELRTEYEQMKKQRQDQPPPTKNNESAAHAETTGQGNMTEQLLGKLVDQLGNSQPTMYPMPMRMPMPIPSSPQMMVPQWSTMGMMPQMSQMMPQMSQMMPQVSQMMPQASQMMPQMMPQMAQVSMVPENACHPDATVTACGTTQDTSGRVKLRGRMYQSAPVLYQGWAALLSGQ